MRHACPVSANDEIGRFYRMFFYHLRSKPDSRGIKPGMTNVEPIQSNYEPLWQKRICPQFALSLPVRVKGLASSCHRLGRNKRKSDNARLGALIDPIVYGAPLN
jgi:hypothetical protein